MADLHPHYPVPAEVDAWCDGLLRRADERQVKAQLMDHPTYEFQLGVRHTGGAYVSFKSPGRRTFYGFWQPAPSGRGPILLHVPGYGAEMSAHPELVSSGYNVLHINPLGYATPGGPDTAQQVNETWPVLPNTVTASGEGGYADWLCDAISAARWGIAQDGVEPERFAFFGTSQGGGTALLLASIFRDLGVRCVAADVPFLINIPLSMDKVEWMRDGLLTGLDDGDQAAAWKALGCVDVIGDFRENIVTVDTERDRLMVLVNPNVAHRRGYSPYNHFEYRHDRSQHGSGYYIYLSPPDTTGLIT